MIFNSNIKTIFKVGNSIFALSIQVKLYFHVINRTRAYGRVWGRVSQSSLQTTQHPSADGCGVVIHATYARLTARTLVISCIDLRGYRAVSARFPTTSRSGSPLDVTCSDITPPSCNFPPSQGYKMPPDLRSSSVFGLTPIEIDHPEDQDHSLGLYGRPFSLHESTFVAKYLRLFHLAAVVDPYSDFVKSELYECTDQALNRVGRNRRTAVRDSKEARPHK